MSISEDDVRALLTAYIARNKVKTDAQAEAFENAVAAQMEYMEANAEFLQIPKDVTGFSIGNYSVTRNSDGGAGFTANTICPAAWAYLYNAGLLRREWPIAKRL